jgi:hypothetical protein
MAPLEMNEGTHWGQGYNRYIRLQCRRRPNKRPLTFNLYYVIQVSIVYGVVHFGISIDICVAFEGMIWSQKTTSYTASTSEVSPKIKKQYSRKMKE